MTTLREVVRHARSKNAGPFSVTVDLFFRDRATYDAFVRAPGLSSARIAQVFAVPAERVKRFEVPNLAMIKFSFPRRQAQGGVCERDMHSGQSYVRLLDLELMTNSPA